MPQRARASDRRPLHKDEVDALKVFYQFRCDNRRHDGRRAAGLLPTVETERVGERRGDVIGRGGLKEIHPTTAHPRPIPALISSSEKASRSIS
jgi:hypothetical protein